MSAEKSSRQTYLNRPRYFIRALGWLSDMLFYRFDARDRAVAVYPDGRELPAEDMTLGDAMLNMQDREWKEISNRSALAVQRMSQRRRMFLGAVASVLLYAGSLGLGGCAAQTSLKGVETRLATKIDNSRKIDAQNVETFVSQEADKWVQRMLAAGLVLMGLSYPVGKVIWIIGERAKAAAAATAKAALIKRRLR